MLSRSQLINSFVPSGPFEFHPVSYTASNFVFSKGEYRIFVFGILKNGAKACMVLDKIDLYCDVRLSAENYPKCPERDDLIISSIKDLLKTSKKDIDVTVDKFDGFFFKEFQSKPKSWARLHFDSISDRKTAIGLLQSESYKTANDDLSFHATYFINSNFNTAGWNRVLRYNEVSKDQIKKMGIDIQGCEYVFRTRMEDTEPMDNILDPELASPKILCMNWDIETFNHDQESGDLPTFGGNYGIFMINFTLSWAFESNALMGVTICDRKHNELNQSRFNCPIKSFSVSTEKDILLQFIACLDTFRPDMIRDFNGSNFDWMCVVDKCTQYGIIDDLFAALTAIPQIRKSREYLVNNPLARIQPGLLWRVKAVKIGAGESEDLKFSLDCPGIIHIDMSPTMKRIYPRSEVSKRASLNFYLTDNDLESKVDMPYRDLWKFHRLSKDSDAYMQEMTLASEYCLYDSHSCQLLAVKRGVDSDYFTVAALTKMQPGDTYIRANGARVNGRFAHYCWKLNYLYSTKIDKNPKVKFPGALVVEPISGIYKDNPATGIDFSSMYPNLVIGKSLESARYIPPHKTRRVAKLRALGYRVDYHEFTTEAGVTYSGYIVHHNNIMKKGEFASTYEADETGIAKKKLLRPELPNEVAGPGVIMLKDSFDARKLQKNAWSACCKLSEKVSAILLGIRNKEETASLTNGAEEIYPEDEDFPRTIETSNNSRTSGSDNLELVESDFKSTGISFQPASPELLKLVKFLENRYNTFQNVLKLLLNSTYGEMGNCLSPMYVLLVAGTVTSSGQIQLRFVKSKVEERGCTTVYGDTDSVYVQCPKNIYEAIHAWAKKANKIVGDLYERGEITSSQACFRSERIEQMKVTRIIEIARDYAEHLKNDINNQLILANGNTYLNVAYEEVLCPCMFLGKKRYFGAPHIERVVLPVEKPFIRGLDFIKQGKIALIKKYGMDIVRQILSIHDTSSTSEIVGHFLGKLRDSPQDPKDFVIFGKYKPGNKQGLGIDFHRRMVKEYEIKRRDGVTGTDLELYNPPVPGDKFKYVFVEMGRGSDYTLEGLKVTHKVSDYVKYEHLFDPAVDKLNISVYLKNQISGVFAGFLSNLAQFLEGTSNDPEKRKKQIADRTKKYVIEKYAELCGSDKQQIRNQGQLYKQYFKNACIDMSKLFVDQTPCLAHLIYEYKFKFEKLRDPTKTYHKRKFPVCENPSMDMKECMASGKIIRTLYRETMSELDNSITLLIERTRPIYQHVSHKVEMKRYGASENPDSINMELTVELEPLCNKIIRNYQLAEAYLHDIAENQKHLK